MSSAVRAAVGRVVQGFVAKCVREECFDRRVACPRDGDAEGAADVVFDYEVRAIGAFRGSLLDMQASDLGAVVIKAAIKKISDSITVIPINYSDEELIYTSPKSISYTLNSISGSAHEDPSPPHSPHSSSTS